MHNVSAIWSFLYVIPWAIQFTWVFNHTKGSIIIAALFHGLHGVMLSFINFLPAESDVPISTDLLTSISLDTSFFGPYFMVLIIMWSLSILIIKGYWGGLGLPPPLDNDPQSSI